MLFVLNRLYDNGNETLGICYFRDDSGELKYDFKIEDEYRKKKVMHETRIPAGEYKIVMRFEGRFYDKYYYHKNTELAELVKKYGIPWLRDVPGFEYILMHIGNDDRDTSGCLLSGMTANNFSREKGRIGDSTTAFVYIMRAIVRAVDSGEELRILINDMDRAIKNLI